MNFASLTVIAIELEGERRACYEPANDVVDSTLVRRILGGGGSIGRAATHRYV